MSGAFPAVSGRLCYLLLYYTDMTVSPARYTQEQVTEAEIQALPPRVHDHIQRTAAHRVANQAYAPTAPWGAYTPTSPAPNRFQRVGEYLISLRRVY